MRRLLRTAGVALTMMVMSTAVSAAPAGATVDTASAEAAFVAQINGLRAQHGVGALVVDDGLSAIARNWSASMASAGRISHNPDLAGQVGPGWSKLGENVGEGPNESVLFAAFVASPPHYQNLVDPAFNRVGVGVAIAADGTIYTTHDFEQRAGSSTVSPPPPSRPSPPVVRPAPAPAPVRGPSVPPVTSASRPPVMVASPPSTAPSPARPDPVPSVIAPAPPHPVAPSASPPPPVVLPDQIRVVLGQLHALDATTR